MPVRRFCKDSRLVFDGLRMLRHVLLDAAIVDAKEFIGSGCHVHMIRLACIALSINKCVNWVILVLGLE